MPIPVSVRNNKRMGIIKTGRQAILVIDGVKMRRQRQLLDVADAMNPFGDRFGASQHGQKNGRQDADDGNDDQQLN